MKKSYLKRVLGTILSATMLASTIIGVQIVSAESGDVVTLNLLTNKISSNLSTYPDSRIMQELGERIGVKINLIEADSDKYNVFMASGEGFDMILTPTTYFSQLVQGGVVMPMDDMLEEYGKDITANIPETVSFSKDNWSNGEGSLYFLPCQIGVDSQGAYQSMGLVTRWDYYKELGCPEITNLDDWMDMLAEMQAAHPETEDGLPVYGVSMFSDWGLWCYKFPMACVSGYNELSGSTTGLYKPATMEYSNILQEGGLFWDSMEYYFKANQRGILDPDAFTTNYDDFNAKGSNGQYLTGPAGWALGSFNGTHASEAVGFESIPTSWSNHWGGTNYTAGWVDKCFGINAKCENPEKAMEFINYIYSYDGCRFLYSGVEGVDYTLEEGVPTLTEENIELYKNGGTPWAESGLGFDRNIVGLGDYTVHPEDGKTLNLFVDPSIYPTMLTECQKDFSEHYGVSYPDEVFQQYREKYDVADQSGTDAFAVALVSAAPDDITRKEASLSEYALAQASKIILAEDQAAFDELKAETLKQFEKMGIQDVIDWYSAEWENAKAKAAEY